MNAEELINEYKIGRRDFSGVDLRGANICMADLTGADLTGANLRGVNLDEAKLRSADLRNADLTGAYLRGADLHEASLLKANLTGANLTGANIDYSTWPLWCGSKNAVVDRRIAAQLVAHVCALICDDTEFQALQEVMLPFARTSHRAKDLGLVEAEK